MEHLQWESGLVERPILFVVVVVGIVFMLVWHFVLRAGMEGAQNFVIDKLGINYSFISS